VDFAELFEVRGVQRTRRGQDLPVQNGDRRIRFRYRGLDKVTRFTEIIFDPVPKVLSNRRASFALELQSDECVKLEVRVSCGLEVAANVAPLARQRPADFQGALAARHREIAGAREGWASITAGHGILDFLLRRSAADLTSIIAHTDRGSFMMAGIPWFATLFGRDSIITALSVLQFNPDIAGRTLKVLAGLQGAEVDDARDEQPG